MSHRADMPSSRGVDQMRASRRPLVPFAECLPHDAWCEPSLAPLLTTPARFGTGIRDL
jgi:hypothetical protein